MAVGWAKGWKTRILCKLYGCMGIGQMGASDDRSGINYDTDNLYNYTIYTISWIFKGLGYSTGIHRHTTRVIEMFIGIFAKVFRQKGEPSMAYYDATRIVKVAEHPTDEGCLFWFHDGDVGGALPFETPSYDKGGLIELVIQARLHPAEFLPSVNVGKRKPEDEPGSTGSLHWSAKDREK